MEVVLRAWGHVLVLDAVAGVGFVVGAAVGAGAEVYFWVLVGVF